MAQLICHAEEATNVCYTLACWHVSKCFHLRWVRTDSGAVNDIPTEVDTRNAELTLGSIEGDACLLYLLQGRKVTSVVLLLWRPVYKDIVNHAKHAT